jgi:hypothetical protein
MLPPVRRGSFSSINGLILRRNQTGNGVTETPASVPVKSVLEILISRTTAGLFVRHRILAQGAKTHQCTLRGHSPRRRSDHEEGRRGVTIPSGIRGRRHLPRAREPGVNHVDAGDPERAPVLNDRRVCSGDRRQTLLMPPSTSMSEPVMNELSSEARKTAAAASSSGRPSLSMGT